MAPVPFVAESVLKLFATPFVETGGAGIESDTAA